MRTLKQETTLVMLMKEPSLDSISLKGILKTYSETLNQAIRNISSKTVLGDLSHRENIFQTPKE